MGEEDALRSAVSRILLLTVIAVLAITQFAAGVQASQTGAAKTSATSDRNSKPSAARSPLPKLWHSDATKHDFRVSVTGDVFHAEWVNVPAAVAKQGAYIHTECRRAGGKWVGSSKVNMLFAVPGAPTGKDTKLCSLTVRFEVDSITGEKITGHSEAIQAFDVKTCRTEQTKWADFTWIPKK